MPLYRSLRTSLAAVAVAVLSVMVAPVVAAPAAAEDSASLPPTMLILDGSSSMLEKDVDGRTRIDVAKDAANRLLEKIGDETSVGLLTYGTTVGSEPEDKVEGCRDITLLSEPVTGKIDELKDKVDSVTPKGFTPIGKALQQAADALPDDGDRTIVLVSDGADTCAPPPVCEVAEELARDGVDLVINTVGLLVDSTAREELECISAATGGSYADAKDAEQLIESVEDAATGDTVGGGSGSGGSSGGGSGNSGSGSSGSGSSLTVDLPGGSSSSDAPEVPSGAVTLHTTVTENGSRPSGGSSAFTGYSNMIWEQAWWIPVSDGERITVGVNTLTASTNRKVMEELRATVLLDGEQSDHQGDSQACVGFGHTEYTHTYGDPDPTGIGVAGVVTKALTGECAADRLLLVVYLPDMSGSSTVEDVPLDITLTRFGEVDLSDQPPAATEDIGGPGENTMTMADSPVDVAAGAWFDDAGQLPEGEASAVESTISPGETQMFRVHAGYGQTVLANLMLADEAERAASSNLDLAKLDLRAFNPARLQVADIVSGDTGGRGLDYPAPININNMYNGDSSYGFRNSVAGPDGKFSTVWLGGQQYFRITYWDTSGSGQPLTYRLSVDVQGTETEGPQFSSIVGAGEFGPEGADGTTNQAAGNSGVDGLAIATVVFAALALIFAAAAFVVGRLGGTAASAGATAGTTAGTAASNPFTTGGSADGGLGGGWGR